MNQYNLTHALLLKTWAAVNLPTAEHNTAERTGKPSAHPYSRATGRAPGSHSIQFEGHALSHPHYTVLLN